MILQALNRLAEVEALVDDPDFEVKPIRWLITIGDGGRLIGMTDTNFTPPQEGKKKPKPQAKSFVVPRCGGRTSGDRAFFLHDKSDYVFGAAPSGAGSIVSDEKLRNRARLFRDWVELARQESGDAGLQAVSEFLAACESGAIQVTLDESMSAGDLFAFIYAPDVDTLVTDRPAVREWWRKQRIQAPGPATAAESTCLVSGKSFSGAGLFPKAKRVPGVQGDISLVSFNSNAFESYGWKSNDNAPVSRDAAEAVATALNRLLHPAFPKPSNPEETLPPRSIRLSGDTGLCYWSSSESNGLADYLASLFEATDVSAVPELYRSVWRGVAPPGTDLSPFFGLVLTGTQGRAIVRGWFETTLGEAQANIARHFADLAIVRNAPWKKGEDPPPAISLRTLLDALAPHGKSDGIPAAVAAEFVHAALHGGPYPFEILTRAISRHRAEIGKSERADLQRRDARAALIKAVLNRLPQAHSNPDFKEVTKRMDPENANPGYTLGCLMGVLERLQQEALGDVNASVVDKHFSGASAAPKATFDRLVKNARHHAKKAESGEKAGFVFRLERLIDALMERINVRSERGQPIGFPLTLPIDQQGLFVIGYHHMRHWLWMNREERDKWEAANSNASRAFLWNTKKQDQPINDSPAN